MGSLLAALSAGGPVDPAVAERMAQAAPHRGGLVKTRRLGRAVVGVTSGDGVGTGDVFVDTALAVAFSGDLDNRKDLTAKLGGASELRTGSGPAAILAAAFRRWGEEAALRLRGPFVAAVTDGDRLWCYRDHLGFRPLFYRCDASGLHVASEVKQVVAGAKAPYEPNLEALEGMFYGWAGREPKCAIRGVKRLPGGSFLRAGGTTCHVRRYWHPERLFETSAIRSAELEERFHHLFEQAVTRCLQGEDAVSLSGGIDSPAIAAYAAPVYRARTGRSLPAISAVYPNHADVDERRYIRIVVEEHGLDWHSHEPKARATDGLADWVRLFDAPVEVVSLSEVYEFLTIAKKLGVRNVLGGELAEFVFDARSHLLAYLVGNGRLPAAWNHVRKRRAGGESARALFREAAVACVPAWARVAHRRFRGLRRDMKVTWIRPRTLGTYLADKRNAWRDLQFYALNGTSGGLEPNDFVQAKAGVAERRPFADIDLLEFFLSVPAETRFPDPRPKWLLRQWLRGRVPDAILDRHDKTVFDDVAMAGIDYPALRCWLVDPGAYRMPGVDYDILKELLQQERLTLRDFMWAKDLAAIHAFLSIWEE